LQPVKKDIRILLLEDNASDAELTRYALKKGGINFSLERVDTKEDYIRSLRKNPPELILSDYSLPGFNGHDALDIAIKEAPETPFIFVTGTMGEEVAIETLKGGATDYVLKTRLSRLIPAVQRALREASERAEHRRAAEQLRESHEQLRALSVYLQTVREEERTRIAREVHDELGQALTGCKLDLSLIASQLKNQKPLLERTKALSAHIDSTIQTVRRIATELRPGVLDHLGLVAALEWQANDFQNRTGIRCEVQSSLSEPLPDQNVSTTFFRIFQETLTNVIRHAGATEVKVDLNESEGRIIMKVSDNGRGISREQITRAGSLGLLGMKERAALLGGTFKIGPVPGKKGTSVTVSIPHGGFDPSKRLQNEDTAGRRSRGSAPRDERHPRSRVQKGHLR
jgi:two-component system, NarL family, sensor histidine kinase UhpB